MDLELREICDMQAFRDRLDGIIVKLGELLDAVIGEENVGDYEAALEDCKEIELNSQLAQDVAAKYDLYVKQCDCLHKLKVAIAEQREQVLQEQIVAGAELGVDAGNALYLEAISLHARLVREPGALEQMKPL